MNSAVLSSPAKLNLFLAVTGRRADGYHDLLSVAAPVAWGDTLRAELSDRGFSLACDDPAVPLDDSNLVLRAARAFRGASGWTGGAAFVLEKRIPTGAGLGGGSSNAVAALRALNLLCGSPLDAGRLAGIAAQIGSDCPLFLQDGPAVLRGRGERVARMEEGASARLSGRRVLLFKPGFGVGTAWAYGKLADAREATRYTPRDSAERRLGAWVADRASPAEGLLFNGFEPVVFSKFPGIPLLLDRLRRDFGLEPRLTGSGSACFALLPDHAEPAAAEAAIRDAWGPSALVVETRLA
jgi:4-diphosphocytidyl-2-C-methyl-D-erythritol kinase